MAPGRRLPQIACLQIYQRILRRWLIRSGQQAPPAGGSGRRRRGARPTQAVGRRATNASRSAAAVPTGRASCGCAAAWRSRRPAPRIRTREEGLGPIFPPPVVSGGGEGSVVAVGGVGSAPTSRLKV